MRLIQKYHKQIVFELMTSNNSSNICEDEIIINLPIMDKFKINLTSDILEASIVNNIETFNKKQKLLLDYISSR
ncbi:hypothetical protein AN641_04935 [Candidatus Epulonipiscioides gigas]|nr:hypothetical protein AN641_04935 [Epulopiscium sp. SCG-C07WGA-EpuloA2]